VSYSDADMPDGADVPDSTPAAGALPVRTGQDVDPSLIGCAIALAGAVLAIIAVWLPLRDPESQRRAHPWEPVDDQLLVQSLTGLLLVGVAMACAVSGFIAYRGRRSSGWPAAAGIVAILLAVLAGTAAAVLAPTHFGAAHGTPGPGLGVYAGLVAGVLMLVGGLLVRQSPRNETLITASVAGVLVATATWWLAGLGERAPIGGGSVTMDGSAWINWPNDGTTPEERRKVGYGTCATQSVESLARLLNALTTDEAGAPVVPRTTATAGSVARGYARYFGDQEELYEGCLQAFRDRR
jgi:hypothetical protein